MEDQYYNTKGSEKEEKEKADSGKNSKNSKRVIQSFQSSASQQPEVALEQESSSKFIQKKTNLQTVKSSVRNKKDGNSSNYESNKRQSSKEKQREKRNTSIPQTRKAIATKALGKSKEEPVANQDQFLSPTLTQSLSLKGPKQLKKASDPEGRNFKTPKTKQLNDLIKDDSSPITPVVT